MASTDRGVRKHRPNVNNLPTRDDRERRRDALPASDLVFYISIAIVAVVLCVIFWTLFDAP